MTQKEKAIELFNKFEGKLIPSHTIFIGEAKKECALIAVDLVILNCYEEEEYYWKEVKEELQKL